MLESMKFMKNMAFDLTQLFFLNESIPGHDAIVVFAGFEFIIAITGLMSVPITKAYPTKFVFAVATYLTLKCINNIII